MASDEIIRVILAKVGLDSHERGVRVIASALREAGMEVVYLGCHQIAEGIVRTVMEEDADVVGLSCHGGEHFSVGEIARLMKESNLDDVLLLVGGIFPREDIPELKEMGVDEVFMGSLPGPVVKYIKQNVRTK